MLMEIILSRSIPRFFRRSNVAYFPPPPTPTVSLVSIPAVSPLFHSICVLSTRCYTAESTSPSCSPVIRGGATMASSGRVKGEELGEQNSTQGVGNEYNGQTIQNFIVHPANEAARWNNVIYGDECGNKRTMEVTNRITYPRGTNCKNDTGGAIEDVIALCGDDDHPISNYKDGMGVETESADKEEMNGVTETSDSEEDDDWLPEGGAVPLRILDNSTHRDGSIYRDYMGWKKDYCIADRNETRLGPMMFSDLKNGVVPIPGPYLQIFSIKVAKIPMDCRSVELYGYIAARDRFDPFLNYIINISREDPIIAEQGSLIEMTGPKRGINFCGYILLEYDMRIKIGDQATDDLQLIDGVSCFVDTGVPNRVITHHIRGDYGAIDFTRALVDVAVEATIDVLISEVHTSFNLSLSSYFSGLHEIQFFCGAIGESRDLRRRFVVAVVMNTEMHLKFKIGVGCDTAEHSCSFKANTHGCATQRIIIEFASISVKVTWLGQP